MIPPFVENEILPAGMHLCTLEEVVDRFGSNERRRQLCGELQCFVDRARDCGFVGLVIWGSFPTGCPEPGDLDLLFVTLPGVSKDNVSRDCAQLLEQEESRDRFGHDFLSCTNDPDVLDYFARYLGYDNRIDKQKGV
jgi:hypothetical protein